jgi:hypothetical protein
MGCIARDKGDRRSGHPASPIPNRDLCFPLEDDEGLNKRAMRIGRGPPSNSVYFHCNFGTPCFVPWQKHQGLIACTGERFTFIEGFAVHDYFLHRKSEFSIAPGQIQRSV